MNLYLYRAKHFFYRIIGLKIDCVGERSWLGFKWSPKGTASYLMKKK